MAKEKPIELTGTVVEAKPGTVFIVEVKAAEWQQPLRVLAKLSGKMRENHIRVLLGDTVKVEVSAYDLTRGRITFREK